MYSLAPNHYLCLDLAISYWLDWPIGTILPTFPSNNVKINHTAFKATTSIPKSLLKYSGKTYSELHEVGKEQNKISSVVNVVKSIFRTWWSTMFIRAMLTPTWQATRGHWARRREQSLLSSRGYCLPILRSKGSTSGRIALSWIGSMVPYLHFSNYSKWSSWSILLTNDVSQDHIVKKYAIISVSKINHYCSIHLLIINSFPDGQLGIERQSSSSIPCCWALKAGRWQKQNLRTDKSYCPLIQF